MQDKTKKVRSIWWYNEKLSKRRKAMNANFRRLVKAQAKLFEALGMEPEKCHSAAWNMLAQQFTVPELSPIPMLDMGGDDTTATMEVRKSLRHVNKW